MIKLCQWDDGKRAYVLIIIILVFAERRFGKPGLVGQLFQGKSVLHPQIL